MTGETPVHFATGCAVARQLVSRLLDAPLPADTILNVNVPDAPVDELRGLKATRLGHRHRAEPVIPARDPRGRRIYWVGAAGAEQDAGPGTDFHAVSEGFVSVTPLQVDLTRPDQLDSLKNWLESDHE
jgi:5'-nucleotidase